MKSPRSIVGVLLMAALLVTACSSSSEGGGDEPVAQTSAAPEGDAPAVSGPAQGTADLPPVTDVSAITAAGLDAGLASFVASATSSVTVVDNHTFMVDSTFPNGATSTVVYQVFAGGDMEPGQPPVVTGARVDDGFVFRMQYAIATADLPDDFRAQVLSGLPATPPSGGPVRGAGSLMRAIVTAEDAPSTLGVIADGVISQGQEAVAEEWVTKVGGERGGNAFKALSNGKKLAEALELNDVTAKALARVRAARDCAVSPTNPLTQRAYQENPNAKQEVLDRLDAIADEITANAAVVVSQYAADILGGAGPGWLGFITGPAVNYVKETLGSISDNLVREAEALVPKCAKKGYRVSGGGGRVTVNGKIGDITSPFTVNGAGDGFVVVFSFTPGDSTGRFGSVEYEGGGSGVTMSGSGEYVISGPDGGVLTLKQTTNGCVDGGGCAKNSETLKLTPITSR